MFMSIFNSFPPSKTFSELDMFQKKATISAKLCFTDVSGFGNQYKALRTLYSPSFVLWHTLFFTISIYKPVAVVALRYSFCPH